jgi:hypothetical protein
MGVKSGSPAPAEKNQFGRERAFNLGRSLTKLNFALIGQAAKLTRMDE